MRKMHAYTEFGCSAEVVFDWRRKKMLLNCFDEIGQPTFRLFVDKFEHRFWKFRFF